MNSFQYANPKSLDAAVKLLGKSWGETEVMAGGTDLVTSLKQGITTPKLVVSLKNIEGLDTIEATNDSVRIGAMVALQDMADEYAVHENFPALVTAATNIGSPQLLNFGTVGGDLLQRPRCWYYRQGFGLFGTDDGKALVPDGDNRYHAIFENDGPAYFVNPSSLAPGLIALDASVHVAGPKGERAIKAADFFTIPKSESEREYAIQPNEILTAVEVPLKGLKNGTYEVRQRRGLDWPMVTASVAYSMDGSKTANGKVVLGHVAPIPYVSESASKALNGIDPKSEADTKAVGKAAAEGASPLSQNQYKVYQVKAAVARAIRAAVA